jgi:acyl-CoA hydrolase
MSPAKVGDILILKSAVNYVGNSSMEVGVRIESENPLTGNIKHTASAYLTFVSLNDKRKPARLHPILAETAEEKRRQGEGEVRHISRKERFKERKL